MFEIPDGVVSPALLREEAGSERITDLSEVKKLLKQRLVRQCGMVVRRVTNGIRKWKPKLPVFEVKRYSGALVSMSGESATMRPSKPSCRAIIRSGYSKRLDGCVHAHPPDVGLFSAWRGATLLAGRDKNGKPLWAGSKIMPVVPQAFIDAGHQGSILYMPNAGPLTAKPNRRKGKVKFARKEKGSATSR
jgi:hypothetical protein